MSAMYQQIATFGKMKACAGTDKFSTKNYYQNDLDTVVGKFIYRYGQRNAVSGNARLFKTYWFYGNFHWSFGRHCRSRCRVKQTFFRKIKRQHRQTLTLCTVWLYIKRHQQTHDGHFYLSLVDIFIPNY